MIVIMLVCVKGEYSTAAVAGRPPGTVTRCQPSQIPSGSKRVHHLPQIQLLILIFKQRATRSQCANTDLSGQSQYFYPCKFQSLLALAAPAGVLNNEPISAQEKKVMMDAAYRSLRNKAITALVGRTHMRCGCEMWSV